MHRAVAPWTAAGTTLGMPHGAVNGVRSELRSEVEVFCIDIVDTSMHISGMAKSRTSSESLVPGTASVAERALASETKDSINLRIDARTRQLVDEAAAVLGKTRTEFMVESARRQAIDVLLDQRLFMLDPERYDAFMHTLDNPPAPGSKLRALLRRTPAWAK